jgi:hypothetical protein
MIEHFWKIASTRFKAMVIALAVTQGVIWLLPLDSYIVYLSWGKDDHASKVITLDDMWIPTSALATLLLLVVGLLAWNITGGVLYVIKRIQAEKGPY